MTLRERAVVRASPEDVWRVLEDWERQATWMPDVAWIRVLGDERELGARVAVRTKVFGLPATTDVLHVTAWDPPRFLAVEHTGFVKGRGEWRLLPVRGGTGFEWIDDVELPLGRLGDLALMAYAPFQRLMLRRSIANLRRLVETPASG